MLVRTPSREDADSSHREAHEFAKAKPGQLYPNFSGRQTRELVAPGSISCWRVVCRSSYVHGLAAQFESFIHPITFF